MVERSNPGRGSDIVFAKWFDSLTVMELDSIVFSRHGTSASFGLVWFLPGGMKYDWDVQVICFSWSIPCLCDGL